METSQPTLLKRRAMTRLAAVQALYQCFQSALPPLSVVKQFIEEGIEEESLIPQGKKLDSDLLSKLVVGVMADQESLDGFITRALPSEWPLDRLDPVIAMILRAGLYELLNFQEIVTPIIISEYLDVTHTFYDGKEVSFINGILDRLAKTSRSAEESIA